MNYDIYIDRGADFSLAFTLKNASGTIVNLTGATIVAQMREYAESLDSVEFDATHNNTGGVITISLSHEETSLVSWTHGVYDVYVIYSNRTVEKVLEGSATVYSNTTRISEGTTLRILSFNSYASFPATGSSDRLYLSVSENKLYRWSGTAYVDLASELQGIRWGAIVGTLSNQTDLYTALSAKVNDAPSNNSGYIRKNGAWSVPAISDVSGLTASLSGKIGYTDNHTQVLYVSPSGNDSNAGTSDAPLKTIQTAIKRTYSGSNIRLAAGTYSGFTCIGKNILISLDGNVTINSQITAQASNLYINGAGKELTLTNNTPYPLVAGNTLLSFSGAASNYLRLILTSDSTISSGIVVQNSSCYIRACDIETSNITYPISVNDGQFVGSSCTMSKVVSSGSTTYTTSSGYAFNISGGSIIADITYSGFGTSKCRQSGRSLYYDTANSPSWG